MVMVIHTDTPYWVSIYCYAQHIEHLHENNSFIIFCTKARYKDSFLSTEIVGDKGAPHPLFLFCFSNLIFMHLFITGFVIRGDILLWGEGGMHGDWQSRRVKDRQQQHGIKLNGTRVSDWILKAHLWCLSCNAQGIWTLFLCVELFIWVPAL